MIAIDSICYSSKLRYVNPEEKFAFSMITLFICVISRSFCVSCIVLLVNGYFNVWKGKIRIKTYVRLMMIPFMFLLFSTFAILVQFSKHPMDGYAIAIGSYYITSSKASMIYGIQLILTALASVSCLYFLSLHTPMTEILEVLRKLHCPTMLIELMMLTYRFVFILLERASSIMTAQKARLGNRNLKTSLDSFGKMLAVLFIHSLKRSMALYDAMESRCYDGRIRVLREGNAPSKKEIAWIICYECMLMMIAVLMR